MNTGNARAQKDSVLAPGLEISLKRRGAQEGDNIVWERSLAYNGNQKPKSSRCFQS